MINTPIRALLVGEVGVVRGWGGGNWGMLPALRYEEYSASRAVLGGPTTVHQCSPLPKSMVGLVKSASQAEFLRPVYKIALIFITPSCKHVCKEVKFGGKF